jgi:hypothetical protein
MFNCRFCEGKEFFDEAQLLKHTQRRHANLLEPGQSTVILQLSRKPPDSDESANPAPSIETVSATPLISPQPRVEVSNEAELPQTSS